MESPPSNAVPDGMDVNESNERETNVARQRMADIMKQKEAWRLVEKVAGLLKKHPQLAAEKFVAELSDNFICKWIPVFPLTFLLLLSSHSDLEVIRYVIDLHPDALWQPRPESGNLPLHDYCRRGLQCSETILRMLIVKHPPSVSTPNDEDMLPIQLYCSKGRDIAVFRALVAAYPASLVRVSKKNDQSCIQQAFASFLDDHLLDYMIDQIFHYDLIVEKMEARENRRENYSYSGFFRLLERILPRVRKLCLNFWPLQTITLCNLLVLQQYNEYLTELVLYFGDMPESNIIDIASGLRALLAENTTITNLSIERATESIDPPRLDKPLNQALYDVRHRFSSTITHLTLSRVSLPIDMVRDLVVGGSSLERIEIKITTFRGQLTPNLANEIFLSRLEHLELVGITMDSHHTTRALLSDLADSFLDLKVLKLSFMYAREGDNDTKLDDWDATEQIVPMLTNGIVSRLEIHGGVKVDMQDFCEGLRRNTSLKYLYFPSCVRLPNDRKILADTLAEDNAVVEDVELCPEKSCPHGVRIAYLTKLNHLGRNSARRSTTILPLLDFLHFVAESEGKQLKQLWNAGVRGRTTLSSPLDAIDVFSSQFWFLRETSAVWSELG